MLELFAFCLLGVFAGLLAGLFGIGGGLIIVPVLADLFERQGIDTSLIMIMAITTSLATIVLTSVSAMIAHHKLGNINWQSVRYMVPWMLIGVMLGSIIADNIPSQVIRMIFIIYLLHTGIKMALSLETKSRCWHLSPQILVGASVIIGLLSAFLGIGGGTLTVPLLLSGNFAMRNAVGVASACGFFIALTATISYVLLGMQATNLPEWSLGYVYLPAFAGIISTSTIVAPLGAKIANYLPAKQLKRYFSVLLFVVALNLMF